MIIFILFQMRAGDDDQQINYRRLIYQLTQYFSGAEVNAEKEQKYKLQNKLYLQTEQP